MSSTLENCNFESDFANDDSANKLLHFRNFANVLNNIDEYARKPDHAESLYELGQINRYLCFQRFGEKVVDLTVTDKKQIKKSQAEIDEVVQIGDWVYIYCSTFEKDDASVQEKLNHCNTLMAFLEMKKSILRYRYSQNTKGMMPEHNEIMSEIESISNEQNRVQRLISQIS